MKQSMVLLGVLGIATGAAAQTTTWNTTTGDWSQSGNWSNSVPTAGVTAEIPDNGAPAVTATGAACNDLYIGTTGTAGAAVAVFGGDLAVAGTTYVGDAAPGALNLLSGTLTVGSGVIGSATAAGALGIGGGIFTASSLEIGTLGAASALSVTGGSADVTGNITLVGAGSSVFVQGTVPAALTVGGTLDVDAFFQVFGPGVTLQVGTLTLGGNATLSCSVLAGGLSPIEVTGTATLNGQFQVVDVGAPDGTYTVLQAGTLAGSFTTVVLPPGWSLSIARGNGQAAGSVTVTKGTSPVRDGSWGRIKAAYGPGR